MLIVILFGSHHAARNWLHVDVHVADACEVRMSPAGQWDVVFPNGTVMRGIVIQQPHDLERLAGLYPQMVIQDDSLRNIQGMDVRITHYTRLHQRRGPFHQL